MIGKTRHGTRNGASTAVITNGVGPARGILRRNATAGRFWHSRTAPPPALRSLVEHFWSVRWDLSGHAPYVQETLPHPNVHLVLQPGRSRIAGPHSGRFVRVLEGRDGVFGVKFKPGGFYPFVRTPICEIANRELALSAVFGAPTEEFEQALLALNDDAAMIGVAVEFLTAHWRLDDTMVATVSDIVASIVDDRSITTVDQLAVRTGLGKRALQRLFQRYVGVSPKWVINRYRLHEAVEQLAQARPSDWTAFALSLGYFDQAHFIRDFKNLVGRTPAEFTQAELRTT